MASDNAQNSWVFSFLLATKDDGLLYFSTIRLFPKNYSLFPSKNKVDDQSRVKPEVLNKYVVHSSFSKFPFIFSI